MLARHDALRPEAVWEINAQSLRQQQFLTLGRGQETFAGRGGQDALKEFCRRALQAELPAVAVDLRTQRVAVTTEPIVLDDRDFGTFTLR